MKLPTPISIKVFSFLYKDNSKKVLGGKYEEKNNNWNYNYYNSCNYFRHIIEIYNRCYSTANVTVNNSNLTSKTSEGIVIEGERSVTINNCNLTDSNTKLNGQSTTYKNIFLYLSMSGDAATGNSEFTANDSKIITNKGDSFYVTNTTSTINLKNNTIINNDNTGNFLRAQKDSWGKTGSNGGDVALIILIKQIVDYRLIYI